MNHQDLSVYLVSNSNKDRISSNRLASFTNLFPLDAAFNACPEAFIAVFAAGASAFTPVENNFAISDPRPCP